MTLFHPLGSFQVHLVYRQICCVSFSSRVPAPFFIPRLLSPFPILYPLPSPSPFPHLSSSPYHPAPTAPSRRRAPLFASTVALAVASKVFPFLPTPALFRIRSAEALARLKKDLDRTLRDAAIGTFLLVAPVLVALALLVLWTSRGGVRGSGVAGGLGEVGGGAEL